jgi:hypothetical protein
MRSYQHSNRTLSSLGVNMNPEGHVASHWVSCLQANAEMVQEFPVPTACASRSPCCAGTRIMQVSTTNYTVFKQMLRWFPSYTSSHCHCVSLMQPLEYKVAKFIDGHLTLYSSKF